MLATATGDDGPGGKPRDFEATVRGAATVAEGERISILIAEESIDVTGETTNSPESDSDAGDVTRDAADVAFPIVGCEGGAIAMSPPQ